MKLRLTAARVCAARLEVNALSAVSFKG
jgi:hypothetical protein